MREGERGREVRGYEGGVPEGEGTEEPGNHGGVSPLPPSSHDRRSGEKRRRGKEGERERGGERERERERGNKGGGGREGERERERESGSGEREGAR